MPDPQYRCNVCGIWNIIDKYKDSHPNLSGKQKRLVHYELEHEDQLVTCIDSVCTKRFIDNFKMQLHYKKVHLKERIYCTFCSASYVEKRKLDKHIDEKHPEKQDKPFEFKCKEEGCEASYSSRRALAVHNQHIHIRKEASKKFRECPICKKVVQSIYHHTAYYHRKKTIPDIACSRCDKMFFTPGDLNRHLKMKVAVTCKVCGKKINKHNLKTHMQSVHENVIFPCLKCEKTFSGKKALNDHIKAVHQGVKSSCRYCEKEFMRNPDRNRHERVVHGATSC